MSVNVKISQKGIFKKNLVLKDLIPHGFDYGIIDERYVLSENKTSDYVIVYDSNLIARGIEISVENKNTVSLSISLPTSLEEIKDFYNIISNICAQFKVNSFMRDDKKEKVLDIEKFIDFDKRASIDALDDIAVKIDSGCTDMYIFGALHPIAIGEKEIKDINRNTLDNLRDFLHSKQKIDAYYAEPHFYKKKDGTIFGCYAIGPDILSIVPLKPFDILGNFKDLDKWYVMLDKGIVAYNDFINNIKNKEYYDNSNVIVNITENE